MVDKKIPLARASAGGLVSVDALKALPLRHPTDFPRPPGETRMPDKAFGYSRNVGRQVAAISLAGKPTE